MQSQMGLFFQHHGTILFLSLPLTLFCALKILLRLSCIIITLCLEARGEWELGSVLLTGQTCGVSPEAGIPLSRLTEVHRGWLASECCSMPYNTQRLHFEQVNI